MQTMATRGTHRFAPHGFTLIELLIVVAIIGILGAIAVPLYNDHVRRGRIVEATANLADARTRMERHFLDNRTYEGGCSAKTREAWSTTSFTIGCDGDAAAANAYVLRATGNANGMNGFEYTVNEANDRTSKGPDAKWGKSDSCWITRKGGQCG